MASTVVPVPQKSAKKAAKKAVKKAQKKNAKRQFKAAVGSLSMGRTNVDVLSTYALNSKVARLQYLSAVTNPSDSNKCGMPDWKTTQKTNVIYLDSIGTINSTSSSAGGTMVFCITNSLYQNVYCMNGNVSTSISYNGTTTASTTGIANVQAESLASVATGYRFVGQSVTITNMMAPINASGRIASVNIPPLLYDYNSSSVTLSDISAIQGYATDTISNVMLKGQYYDYWTNSEVFDTFSIDAAALSKGKRACRYSRLHRTGDDDPGATEVIGPLVVNDPTAFRTDFTGSGTDIGIPTNVGFLCFFITGLPATNTAVLQFRLRQVIEILPSNQIVGSAGAPAVVPPMEAQSVMADINSPMLRKLNSGVVSHTGDSGDETLTDLLRKLLRPEVLAQLHPDTLDAVRSIAVHPTTQSLMSGVKKGLRKYGPDILGAGISMLPVPEAGLIGQVVQHAGNWLAGN